MAAGGVLHLLVHLPGALHPGLGVVRHGRVEVEARRLERLLLVAALALGGVVEDEVDVVNGGGAFGRGAGRRRGEGPHRGRREAPTQGPDRGPQGEGSSHGEGRWCEWVVGGWMNGFVLVVR